MKFNKEMHTKAIELCNDPKNDYKSTSDLCYMSMEFAYNAALNKICDFIKTNAYKYGKVRFIGDKATFDFHTDRLIGDLKTEIGE
jgi:hypothetical protein